MLFALLFDKLIFGHTPGIMSILGSSLILGSAITVALQQDPSAQQEKKNIGRAVSGNDEESGTTLLHRDAHHASDLEPSYELPVHEIHMRALR